MVRRGLYAGTAEFYDRFRPPYPDALFADLRRRVPVSGTGRLLDLACGTGQVAVPLAADFAEVVAIDAEPETIEFAARVHRRSGITWLVGAAENAAVDGPFELITVGTAFHRLDRAAVAARMRELVAPDGAVALLWSPVPNDGDQPWQRALRQLVVDWVETAAVADRLPAGWEDDIRARPHRSVLEAAGFRYEGRYEFRRTQTWTVDALVGFLHSTSILSRVALGEATGEFASDVHRRLTPFTVAGLLHEEATFAYELARPCRDA